MKVTRVWMAAASLVVWGTLLLMAGACTSLGQANSEPEVAEVSLAREAQVLFWDELIEGHAEDLRQVPFYVVDEALMTPERLMSLRPELRRDLSLARLAVQRGLHDPSVWRDGVFAQLGTARLYVTTRERVPDYDRLYWIMAHMLSEKYGCLVVEKQNFGDTVRVRCKDKRQIVMWRESSAEWLQFLARQFDQEGFEIKVEKRKVHRLVGGERFLL